MRNDCILIYSGGLDSTVLLYDLLDGAHHPHCICFNYGQQWRREINLARDNAKLLGLEFSLVDLTPAQRLIMKGVTPAAPFVPNRNMIFLSIAVGAAVAADIHHVYVASNASDTFPDSTPQFVTLMDAACKVANDYYVDILTPYHRMTKAQIVSRGLKLHVPFEETASCYKGFSVACGECKACAERLRAFSENAVEDPITYVDREKWRQASGHTT